jgi:hypothetical protein
MAYFFENERQRFADSNHFQNFVFAGQQCFGHFPTTIIAFQFELKWFNSPVSIRIFSDVGLHGTTAQWF